MKNTRNIPHTTVKSGKIKFWALLTIDGREELAQNRLDSRVECTQHYILYLIVKKKLPYQIDLTFIPGQPVTSFPHIPRVISGHMPLVLVVRYKN